MARCCGLVGLGAGLWTLASACVAAGSGTKEPVSPKNPPAAECTVSPDAYKEVLDLQSPLIEKVIESKMNEHDQTQVVKLKDGPVVKVSAGGCAHWGLTVSVERLPDGGTGMMPMHRMVWVLETVPGKRDGIKTMLQELLVTAKKVAATEKPSGKKTASYSEACHEGTCTFDWSRHTDMALDLKATYSLPL